MKTEATPRVAATAEETVLVERRGAIAVVTISRPKVLNALNTATLDRLERVIDELSDDSDVRGMVITGAGPKSFVAGADIEELSKETALSANVSSRRGQRVFRKIERAGKPVVAAVNGFALGGGCELALACHLRVASKNARMGLPEVSLGIIPGYAGTQRLPRVVGRGRALEMVLTGKPVDADEGYRIGLVNRVVETPEECVDAACELLGAILSHGPLAVAAALEAVLRGSEAPQEDGEDWESNLFGLLASSEDMHEGMNAFLQKRKPDFRGK